MQIHLDHVFFMHLKKLGHHSGNLVIIATKFFLVTKYFAATRFLEIEAPPFAQKGIRMKYKF